MALERRNRPHPSTPRPGKAVPDLLEDDGAIAHYTLRTALVNLGLAPQEVDATLVRHTEQILRAAAERVAALPATPDGQWIAASRQEIIDALTTPS
jgi:hypothetical protein